MKPLHVAFVWHMHQPRYERKPAGFLSSPAARAALLPANGLVELITPRDGIRLNAREAAAEVNSAAPATREMPTYERPPAGFLSSPAARAALLPANGLVELITPRDGIRLNARE